MEIKQKIDTPSVLTVVFLLTFFCAKTFPLPDIAANGLIACLVYVMHNEKVSSSYILIASVMTMLILVSMAYNGNASIPEVLWVWCYLGVALILTKYKISSNLLSIVVVIVAFIYGLQILLGVEATDAISSGSGNNISTYILFYVMLVYLKRHEERKKIVYWPSVVAIALSVWGNGRAGILASVVMLILLFLYDYIYVNKGRIGVLLKIIAILIIAMIAMNLYFDSYIESLSAKIDRYGYSSVRTEIWKEYLNSAFDSVWNLIFGVPISYSNTPTFARYSGNPHNAFIMLHIKYGLVGFLCVCATSIFFVIKYFKKKNYLSLIVFITWFIRSMFDWTGFPGIFDVLFFYLAIKSIETKQKKSTLQVIEEGQNENL